MHRSFLRGCPYVIIKPLKSLYGSIPYERKLGKTFYETHRFLQQTRNWSADQRETYQLCELSRLLRHAYMYVPYYRRVFDERGIHPDDIRDCSDLSLLPYLTRDIIRDHLCDLLAINCKSSRMQYKVTGGTIGVPMGFYDQKGISESREWAFVTHLWESVGYDVRKPNRSVILRGVIPERGHYEYKGLQLVLSSYHLQQNKMADYVQRIEQFDPDYIQAYPSSIGILSKYILHRGVTPRLKNLKAILCTSEVLYDYTRKQIEDAFRTRVYSFYGHTERSCLAGECENNSDYHLVGEYGIAELIDSFGNPVTGENESGEIVCTGFNNYVMPFIRYRTGDIGVLTHNQCSCNRSLMHLKTVSGRVQDYLIDKSGEPVTFINSDSALWPVKDKIVAYQYVQSEPGRVRLDIEHTSELCRTDLHHVREEFSRWYPAIEAEIRTVDHIERTSSGKIRYLVQNISEYPMNTRISGL